MKRRQAMVGTIVSTKCAKSITVQVIRKIFFPKYNKWINRQRKFMAHDETEDGKLGDIVRIVPCRPRSRKKRHMLIDIIKKGQQFQSDGNVKDEKSSVTE